MYRLLDKKTWSGPYAMQTWGSFIAFIFSSIVFFASFGSPSWWVTYYDTPEDLKAEVQFGLWRLCVRDYCVYDMTDKYMVRNFLPEEAIQPYFRGRLIPAQVMMALNVVFIIVTGGLYIAFIVGTRTRFIECLLQFTVATLTASSLATFGVAFRGEDDSLPFGYSYWLGCIATFFFLINSIVMTFIAVARHQKHQDQRRLEKM